jgi:hypothetical protein
MSFTSAVIAENGTASAINNPMHRNNLLKRIIFV